MEISFERFCEDVAEILKLDRGDLGDDQSIVDDLGIDSLKLLDLSAKLENMYDVKYSSASFIEMDTVTELYEYTKKLLDNK